MAQVVKNLPAMQVHTQVWSLGQEDSPGEQNGNPLQYSCLGNSMGRGAWRAIGQGTARVGQNWATNTFTFILNNFSKSQTHWATSLSLFTFMHWRRKWQPTPVFLPGESQGRCYLWSRRVGHDCSDLAAVAAAAVAFYRCSVS